MKNGSGIPTGPKYAKTSNAYYHMTKQPICIYIYMYILILQSKMHVGMDSLNVDETDNPSVESGFSSLKPGE